MEGADCAELCGIAAKKRVATARRRCRDEFIEMRVVPLLLS